STTEHGASAPPQGGAVRWGWCSRGVTSAKLSRAIQRRQTEKAIKRHQILSRQRHQVLHQLLDSQHPGLGLRPVLLADQAVVRADAEELGVLADELDQLARVGDAG